MGNMFLKNWESIKKYVIFFRGEKYVVPSISFQTFFRMGTFIDTTHMKL